MSSSRLPGKVLKPIGNQTLIGALINRLSRTNLPIFVATSNHETDSELYSYLQSNHDVNVFRGNLTDVHSRFLSIVNTHKPQYFIRITGDNVLIDINGLEECLHALEIKNYDYVDGIGPNGYIPGLGYEVVRAETFTKFVPKTDEHKEHVTLLLRESSCDINYKEYNRGFSKKKYPKLSYTIDTPEDYNSFLQEYQKDFPQLNLINYET
jgi:spore coat polysaccharide biosynthesis protein SpsF